VKRVIVVLVLALLASAAPARAGVYEVYACGGPAGGAQNAFVAAADGNMSAYSICPPGSPVGTGVVTKATSSGGYARPQAGAYQIFTAPAGSELANVTFNVGAIRLSADWSVGVVAFDGDFIAGDYPFGCYPWNSYCGIGTSVFSIPVSVNLYSHQRFRFETRCVNPGGCATAASPYTPANPALFSAANILVRVRDVSAPALSPHHGALWGDGWHRGPEEMWTSYTDNVGIMASRLYADGAQLQTQDYRDGSWPDWVRCNFTRPRPCVDIVPGGLGIDTATLSDGAHQIAVEAVDAAGNAARLHHTIQVDNHAPVKPEGTSLAGGDGWRGANDFEITWSNPAGQVAPIARARYRVCRADGGTCVEGVREGEGISSMHVAAPGPGEWLTRVWLEDAAGNNDPARSGDPVRLRLDDSAPTVTFEASDPDDPLLVRASVADVGSGVVDGWIELRRLGERAWQDMNAHLRGGLLEATLDDLALPDGTYEFRAQVHDAAGLERTDTRRADGAPMRLTLPLRAASRISLLDRSRCRQRSRGRAKRCAAQRSDRVRGNGATIRGELRAGGAPVRHASLAIFSRPRTGGPFAIMANTRTDESGRFSFRAASGPSRTLRFHWPGTRHARPAQTDVHVLVAARSSIVVNRRAVLNGDTVTFTGALRAGPVPDGGKLIDLQAHYRGRWRTFATPRTDAAGRWSYPYRFEATRGLVVYRFRARIRREAAYPYELGHSRVVRVTVRG
jgi:hypothetical protein